MVRDTAPSQFRDRVSLSSQPTAVFAQRKGKKRHSLSKDAPDENTSHSVYVGEFRVPPLAPTATASARDTVSDFGKEIIAFGLLDHLTSLLDS